MTEQAPPTEADPRPYSHHTHTEPRGVRWGVTIRWKQFGERYEPDEVTVHGSGRPVTASVLRRLPYGEIIAACRRRQRELAVSAAGNRRNAGPARLHLLAEGARFGPQRGVPLAEAELAKVAEAYREAYFSLDGRSVTKAVAKACNVSESTAGKRIMKARRAGLLDGIGGRP
jgi:hypothetical protein